MGARDGERDLEGSRGWGVRDLRAIAASGLVTAAPLLCFHAATRRLPLVSVGMFQYLSPTLSLLLAVFLYAEPFERAQAVAFGCVWAGLACFAVDALRETRPQPIRSLPLSGQKR